MIKIVNCSMRAFCGLALVLFTLQLAYGMTEITGTVTEKRAGSVKVEFEPHKSAGPKTGDRVDFKKLFKGYEASAGHGEVTESGAGFVWVKTNDNRPNLEMIGVIQSTGVPGKGRTTQRISAAPLHRCDELAGDPFDEDRFGPSIEYNHIDAGPAIAACENAIEQNPDTARFLYQLGRAYHVNEEYKKAIEYFHKSSDQGYVFATYIIGIMFYEGRGASRDYAEAVKWFRKAEEQGLASAQFYLGVMYSRGRGVTKDDAEAVKWYLKAAGQGYASAQYNLGHMFSSGSGVAQDDMQSVKWYRKAAEQGVGAAQVNLGIRYEDGRGVAKDYAEAVKWYRKAAEQGVGKGQYFLGTMYENGQGVPKDIEKAIKWYRKAVTRYSGNAKKALERLGVGE